MARGLQACLGGFSAPLAALAVLEEPGRIWQQEESLVTLLCPAGRDSPVLLRALVVHSWGRVLGWVDTRSVAVDQRFQGSVSLTSHYLCCFTSLV